MTDKKIIAVVGGTGLQSGGLARSILEEPDGEFALRIVTRDTSSPAATRFAGQGAELVAGDVNDPDSVAEAFKGAYGAYCLSFFWSDQRTETELRQARIQAEAAEAAGLSHVIWSTLPDPRSVFPLRDRRMPTVQGRHKVPHFEAKHEANHYFTDLGLPTTFLQTVFYYENFINFGLEPQRDLQGGLVLNLPLADAPLPMIAADDIGRAAHGIFRTGPQDTAELVDVIGEHLTGDQIAAALSEALGEKVDYQPASFTEFASFGFPGATELANQHQFYAEMRDAYADSAASGRTIELAGRVTIFADWLAKNNDRIPRH